MVDWKFTPSASHLVLAILCLLTLLVFLLSMLIVRGKYTKVETSCPESGQEKKIPKADSLQSQNIAAGDELDALHKEKDID